MQTANVRELIGRLIKGGVAYQAASVLSACFAIFTLKIYTSEIPGDDYGVAETLLTTIILCSIILRFGFGEALLRFWFIDKTEERRRRIARVTFWFVLSTTTAATLLCLLFAKPLTRLLLDSTDTNLMAFGALGLWGFTNLGVVYAILRAQELRRVYGIASLINVIGTVGLTVLLVAVFHTGVHGYLAGNYLMNIAVTVGLWWPLRDILFTRKPTTQGETKRVVRKLLRFGMPTVPADVSVFALNVVDRVYLLQTQGKAAAGLYALAAKLATVLILVTRAFQLAWPPLAYSIHDEQQAKVLYARVTTYLVCVVGFVVCALTLLGRVVIKLLAASEYAQAYPALPWVALGWGLYGIFVIYTTIAAHAKLTARTIGPTFLGLGVNVLLLVLLVDPLGIAGAGIALCGAYLATMASLHLLTRKRFTVQFEWARIIKISAVFAGVTVCGEFLLPTEGIGAISSRVIAILLTPLLLVLLKCFSEDEYNQLKSIWQAMKRKRS